MVFGGIALNMEINMDLHHHHTISSQSYQPFSLLVGGVPSHQNQRAHASVYLGVLQYVKVGTASLNPYQGITGKLGLLKYTIKYRYL